MNELGLICRHPEVAAKRPSKGDGRILRGSLTLAPQDDRKEVAKVVDLRRLSARTGAVAN